MKCKQAHLKSLDVGKAAARNRDRRNGETHSQSRALPGSLNAHMHATKLPREEKGETRAINERSPTKTDTESRRSCGTVDECGIDESLAGEGICSDANECGPVAVECEYCGESEVRGGAHEASVPSGRGPGCKSPGGAIPCPPHRGPSNLPLSFIPPFFTPLI